MSTVAANRYLTLEEMQGNAEYIYQKMLSFGWSYNSICAILGNMQSESTINAGIYEGLVVDNSKGYGLVQWTPATKYFQWADSNGFSPYDSYDYQCQRILYEVENNIQWGNDSQGNPPPYIFSVFVHSVEDVVTLANYFIKYYERPADDNQPIRGEQAQYWANYLGGVTPQPSSKKRHMPIWFYV